MGKRHNSFTRARAHTRIHVQRQDGFYPSPPLTPSPHGAADLRALADRLDRLRPDWRNAERFFEERAELVAALRALAAAMGV